MIQRRKRSFPSLVQAYPGGEGEGGGALGINLVEEKSALRVSGRGCRSLRRAVTCTPVRIYKASL